MRIAGAEHLPRGDEGNLHPFDGRNADRRFGGNLSADERANPVPARRKGTDRW